MCSSPFIVFIITASSWLQFQAFSQDIPSIACPNLFQYLSYGGNYIGKITINDAPFSAIRVEAQFSQREPITTNYNGRLSLIDSLPVTQANLENGRPISYRVDFPNPRILPKLMRIQVNSRTVCSDYGLPPPSTIFTIHHIFYPSTSTFSRVVPPQNRFENPFNEEILYSFGKDFTEANKFFSGQGFETSQPPKLKNPFIPQANNGNRRVAVASPTFAPTFAPTQAPIPSRNSASTLTCGQEGSSLTPFIVGGNDFERGRFPWLTAIYVRQSADLKFTCGGSLISARTVVTAAHCFLDAQITADRIVVYLGRHNLYSSESGVEQRDIETLVKHPDFNTSAISDADIALLQMRIPVSFTQFIRPICLWTATATSQIGLVAGWGADNNGQDVTPMPKVVEVNIASESVCLRSSEIFSTLTSARSICAGKRDNTGPCIGDSGSGLMVNDNGRWTLRAITSLGLTNHVMNRKVCVLSEYVVYCDLSKHISWVRRNML